jgi:hypothetical protein
VIDTFELEPYLHCQFTVLIYTFFRILGRWRNLVLDFGCFDRRNRQERISSLLVSDFTAGEFPDLGFRQLVPEVKQRGTSKIRELSLYSAFSAWPGAM